MYYLNVLESNMNRLDTLLSELEEHSKRIYRIGMKRAILNYILLDPSEQARLRIYEVDRTPRPKTIRGPVPWHASYVLCREVMRNNLHLTHPVSVMLRNLWDKK